MYNPAKVTNERPAPEGLHIQYTVSVVNIAMHYVYLQLISLYILHIKKSDNKTFNIFNFTYFDYGYFSAFFSSFFEKQTCLNRA